MFCRLLARRRRSKKKQNKNWLRLFVLVSIYFFRFRRHGCWPSRLSSRQIGQKSELRGLRDASFTCYFQVHVETKLSEIVKRLEKTKTEDENPDYQSEREERDSRVRAKEVYFFIELSLASIVVFF